MNNSQSRLRLAYLEYRCIHLYSNLEFLEAFIVFKSITPTTEHENEHGNEH